MTSEELDKIAGRWRRLDPDAKQLLKSIIMIDLQERVHKLGELFVKASKKIGACESILNRVGATPEMWREAEAEVEARFAVDMAVDERVAAARAEANSFREFIEKILQSSVIRRKKRAPTRKKRGTSKRVSKKA